MAGLLAWAWSELEATEATAPSGHLPTPPPPPRSLPRPPIKRPLGHQRTGTIKGNYITRKRIPSMKRPLQIELGLTEKNLKIELERGQAAVSASQAEQSNKLLVVQTETQNEAQEDAKSALLDKLENKKIELCLLSLPLKKLFKIWRKSGPRFKKMQRSDLHQLLQLSERILDKLFHSLIEQLEVKQAQAGSLDSEIRLNEMELERLKVLSRSLETSSANVNIAKSRFGRIRSAKGHVTADYIVDPHYKPSNTAFTASSAPQVAICTFCFSSPHLGIH
ncbi:hypothetical protein ACH5RR_011334 [Cinchona calisaya]|uniref:Uncharacterized protein n=1 Tax=Cinchona calisaya TaxID=153742 RepID=A0ABD3A559_9GENT